MVTTNLRLKVTFLPISDTNRLHPVEFWPEYKEKVPFFCLASSFTSPFSGVNGCDFDRIFTSVNGCKKTFWSRSLVGLKTNIKPSQSWGCWFWRTSPLVTVSLFAGSVPAPPFHPRTINGGLFRRSRWSCAQQQSETNILLWLHKQVIIFLGGRMDYFRYTLRLQPSNSCDLIAQWRLVWN